MEKEATQEKLVSARQKQNETKIGGHTNPAKKKLLKKWLCCSDRRGFQWIKNLINYPKSTKWTDENYTKLLPKNQHIKWMCPLSPSKKKKHEKKNCKKTLHIELNIFKQEFGDIKNHLESGIQNVQKKKWKKTQWEMKRRVIKLRRKKKELCLK